MFTVFPPSKSKPKGFSTPFALEKDNWNDYSFQTQYHLYAQPREMESDDPEYLGPVKILRLNQTKSDGLQISENFEKLGPEFASVGDSLDYYQRLNLISSELRDSALVALRDVVYAPEIRPGF